MSSPVQRPLSGNERITPHPEIMLVGGSAIKLEPKTPEMVDYQMYHQENYNINSNFKDINLNMNDGLMTHGQSSGGLFRPYSSLYNVPMNTDRPVSVTPQPPNTTPLPPSTSPKPPLGPRSNTSFSKLPSRPTSAMYSRPQSSVRPGSRFDHSTLPDDIDIDPDHEPMTDVLSRLDQYSQNYVPSLHPAYTDCECTSEESKLTDRQASMYDSDSGDSDEDDDEDTAVSFDVLLKMFNHYEDKGHSVARQKAMMTLVDSYISTETLSEQQCTQVYNYLISSQQQVQEACLVLLKQCVKNSHNLQKWLEKNMMVYLYECLIKEDHKPLRRSALLLMEAVLSQSDFKAHWNDILVSKILPKLISMVRGSVPLDVKYAACCVFRSVALLDDFISYTIDEILPCVLLMRNASAKFKEVYVEILTGVLSHTDCIPPDLIDNSAIPITVSIIREGPCGPQCAAFHLLSSLTTNDAGVSMVINTDSLIPMLLCCMKSSHCRKVRHNATEVISNLSASRKLGLCKDIMVGMGRYFVPGSEPESLSNLSQTVTNRNAAAMKMKHDEEHQMWTGLEKFIDMTKSVIYREAKVETDDLGLVTKIHMKPCIDTCSVQLGLLSQAFYILQHVCLWPLDKSRLGFSANRVDLTTFTDDEQQRLRLSKVNRGLTQAIWDKVGLVATDLLLSYAEKLSSVNEDYQKKGLPVKIDMVFESQELTLINKLLGLILCSALCTCVAFPEILPKLVEKSPKKGGKSSNKLKSFSSSHVTQAQHEHKCGQDVESRLKSQSDTGKGFNADDNKIWVKENPHLTVAKNPTGQKNAAEKSKADLKHKEACTERRLLRKCLYESRVFMCVSPFIKCSDEHIQVLVLQILRCLIQPLEERVAPKLSWAKANNASGARQRPQTASVVQGSSRRLNMALQKMSPDMADIMRDAMGIQDGGMNDRVTSQQTVAGKVNIPNTGIESIQERLQEFTESNKSEMDSKKTSTKSPRLTNPVIDRCRPIAQQCREALVDRVGEKLVMGIFSRCHAVKRQCVLILHDFVHFGERECHMQLSQYKCIPRLIDFLRVNEDNELLEVMCLIIVRMLVVSDSRLKQLFNRHGGPQLLLSMSQYSKGLLKQEVSTTLKTVSKVEAVKKRPMSAPVMRSQNARAPDVWDYIGSRWKQEDQVAMVLRQWMIDDRKHKKQ